MKTNFRIVALVWALAFTTAMAFAADPLPSWNDGKAKQSIIAFVEKVTTAGLPDFVPIPERIPAKAGTPSCASMARCNRGSTRHGSLARSSW